jgi:hypothetical protein
MTKKIEDVTFTPTTMIKLVKAYNTAELKGTAARETRYTVMFAADIRHTDTAKRTTRLANDEWEALCHSIKVSQKGEMGRVAKLSKEEYKAEKAAMTEADGKVFAKLRQASSQAVGSIMRDIGVALLRLDTDEEKARVQSLKDAKKSEAEEAEEAGTEEAKTMQEKIIVQLTNTVAIMEGNDAPDGFDFVALQGAIGEALEIMGVKLRNF